MSTLVFATNNNHKINEIRAVIGSKFNIITLEEAGINIDIPEPHETIEENAAEKSSFIYNLTKKDCFGEDTGLEVEALNGAPGVHSAIYSGSRNFKNNIDLLLKNLQPFANKNAQFKTIISVIINGKQSQFEGICKGTITATLKGNDGFGYDPIFIPNGSTKTFAQMTMEEKNIYSHRKKATDKLIEFLMK